MTVYIFCSLSVLYGNLQYKYKGTMTVVEVQIQVRSDGQPMLMTHILIDDS